MIKKRYLIMIEGIFGEHLDKKSEVFIFGSYLTTDFFDDIEVGFDKISRSKISEIKETFEKSNLPYKVDLVDFSKAKSDFKKKVYKGKIYELLKNY
jgi:hypothetical protein